MKKEGIFDSFCTPNWATTLVIGKIEDFTANDLDVMKSFIDDEIARRKRTQVAA